LQLNGIEYNNDIEIYFKTKTRNTRHHERTGKPK